MIAMQEIRKALTRILKDEAEFPYEVHFDNVKDSSKSYFYIEIDSKRRTFDRVYYERSLSVDIQLRLLPDKNDRIHRSELYAAADKLDCTIRPIVKVEDRYITVLDIRSRIASDILHYEFKLDFADYLPIAQPERMETLDLNLKTGNFEMKLEEETEDGE